MFCRAVTCVSEGRRAFTSGLFRTKGGEKIDERKQEKYGRRWSANMNVRHRSKRDYEKLKVFISHMRPSQEPGPVATNRPRHQEHLHGAKGKTWC